MYKTASPYVKELLKCGINWSPFTAEPFRRATEEDKMIFIHIGNISNIENRNTAYSLFSTPSTIELLNNSFIPIILDTEDVPEAHLIGMDLLLINEKKISNHINIFALPGAKPVISFSSLNPDDFRHIAEKLLESFACKREKLEAASSYLTGQLKYSGVVTVKEPEKNISPKLLHAYIRSWSTRFLDKTSKMLRAPYTLSPRNLHFILEYAWKYKMQEYLNYIDETLSHVYYSPMFDPIDGGIFSHAGDYSFKSPSYEKNIYENANAIILLASAYKYFKKRIYKEAAERIMAFLESGMMYRDKGFTTYVTLTKSTSESTYYKYSLEELHKAFPDRWKKIANALGMDIAEDAKKYQTISNTKEYWLITFEELETLKKIRKTRQKEVIYDKRVMTGYNCRTAIAYCAMAQVTQKGEKKEYLAMASWIIGRVLNRRRNGSNKLYKYITSTNVEYSSSDLYDYSLFLNCLLRYHSITKDELSWKLAKEYAGYIFFNHYQPANGMFSKTAKNEYRSPVKRAPVIDYNTLSSNSIMADNMLLLHKIAGDNKLCMDIFLQQIYNIEPQMIGSGPFMAGWGMQLLNYLSIKDGSAPEKE